MRLVGSPEVEAKALELIREAGMPVSIDYVARSLGVSWQTARTILLYLVIKGKLKMIDTTKGPVFILRKESLRGEA